MMEFIFLLPEMRTDCNGCPKLHVCVLGKKQPLMWQLLGIHCKIYTKVLVVSNRCTCTYSVRMSLQMYMYPPSFGKLIQKALHLVDTDGQVARITQPLPLRNALEDVSEVVYELSKGDGHSPLHLSQLWRVWAGGRVRLGLCILLLVRCLQRFLKERETTRVDDIPRTDTST